MGSHRTMFRPNDPCDGKLYREMFSYWTVLPEELLSLEEYLVLAGELSLLYRHDVLATGISLEAFRTLESAMSYNDIRFLSPAQPKLQAMYWYYGTIDRIPLRMLLFGTPTPARLASAGITSLQALLSLEPDDLKELEVQEDSFIWNTHPRGPEKALSRTDIFSIQIALSDIGRSMRPPTRS